MIQRDYLVIGAGAAGDAVCEAIRSYDKKGSILLAGAEHYAPYKRFELSKDFLPSPKSDPDSLALRPPDWSQKLKVDFRKGVYIAQINLDRHLAVLSTGQAIEFNKACLATGSRPRRPQVAGTTLGNIFYPRTVNDLLALREVLAVKRDVVVVGGGFLAAEMCTALLKLKCKVTMLDRHERMWGDRVDPDTAEFLTNRIQQAGIQRMGRESLNGFEGKTILRNVQTKSGSRFAAAVAVVAAGADPVLDLVANTPLSSPLGTPVTELLESEEKGIYAAGDVALYPDRIFGGMRRVDHWNHARAQGSVAGANMTGKKRIRFQLMPEWESHVLDLHFHFLGDFSRPPGRTEITGDREKGSFIAKYFHGEKLHGALLCNRRKAEEELAELRTALNKTWGVKTS